MGPRWSTAKTSTIATIAGERREHQPLHAAGKSPRFQASNGPNGSASSSGTISGPNVRLKIRRPDRDLLARQAFEHQRIERADEHGRARRHQQEVVEHEAALAADRLEQAARPHVLGAQREEREPAAGEQRSGSRG